GRTRHDDFCPTSRRGICAAVGFGAFCDSLTTIHEHLSHTNFEQLGDDCLCFNQKEIIPQNGSVKRMRRASSEEGREPQSIRCDNKDKAIKADTTWKIDYPRQGSNLRPFAPEANALIH